jgi:hypothetical protein
VDEIELSDNQIKAIEDRFRTVRKHALPWRLTDPVEERGLRFWPEIRTFILGGLYNLTASQRRGFEDCNTKEEQDLLQQLRARYLKLVERKEAEDKSRRLAEAARRLLTSVPYCGLNGGVFIAAPRGHGKSRLIGRMICRAMAREKIGCVVLDPLGGTIDNVLDSLNRLDEPERSEVFSRIRYMDMSGETGFVPRFPLLYRRSDESLYNAASRVVDLIGRIDPALHGASIQGFRRMAAILTPLCMVFLAYGLPIDAVFAFLDNPHSFDKHLKRLENHPEARNAALDIRRLFLTNLLSPQKQEERTEVLRNRLQLVRHDPVSRAMFTTPPTVDWDEVSREGLQLYIDFSHEEAELSKEMKLFAVWQSLLSYIARRGSRGRSYPPLLVVMDELMWFVDSEALSTLQLIRDLRQVIQMRMRNANIGLCLATQSISQLPEELAKVCLDMSNQLYGTVSDTDQAISLAKRWFELNPDEIKWLERHYSYNRVTGTQVSTTVVFRSLEEQAYIKSRKFTNLQKHEWLYARSEGEGYLPMGLNSISTESLDPGIGPKEQELSGIRRRLSARDGIPVSSIPARSHEKLEAREQPAQIRRNVKAASKTQKALPDPQPEATESPPKKRLGRRED